MIIAIPQIQIFFFILARIAGLFIQAPVLSSRSIPMLAKTALAVWIAIILWFIVPVKIELIPQTMMEFFSLLIVEVALGFTIGFTCNLFFLAAQSAGQFIDLQMGLSVSQSFDPIFGAAISIMEKLMLMLVLVIFLIANGHHLLLAVIQKSFELIPTPAVINFASPSFVSEMMGLGKSLLSISLQLAMPIILVIFIIDFCFGIVSRVAPQVNVFMLGFQLKPPLGLLTMLFILPILIKRIASLLGIMGEEMIKLISALRI
ncbi:flagellar biosynthetic protein FliR [candidate division WOR-1 bacterium RIFOXYC2_FULL_37_10]|uniref:Flagellar biosynthetic protein FliR n=1 Tax=candidate division WOR-1 bacterium RIFOXYB2_FULL_37_13 TaxID=1802579 RepID=A0A1F4SLP8_UNCSA|nr:MAG: flagellar biosynthetic protein FliR [candidate division WOR-1 bacterium RIFOXYA2_FULL_37_7]OGC21394.1 MAG: flagellar biosynthetic protein FliR [candidate division WOR-1 bacterium RIFOXYB2_FULL_37_13]OGC33458.1 MAG: flagellar biosynthetic protein FliR [candidate division WOR-1 bacterium RIFOXYC2_FULL_37_10]